MGKRQALKMQVSTRALILRINRKIKAGNEVLRISRTERMRRQVGDYYLLDLRLGGVTGKNVDPAALGRKLGVLKPYEEVSDE